MSGAACGRLNKEDSDVEYRQHSRHYEKSSVRKSRRLDILGFCRLRCKPIAEQSPVGVFRAAVLGRRAICDTTTTMHTTRRSTTERNSNIHRSGCSGVSWVSWGVPAERGGSRDTLIDCFSGLDSRTHSKKSKVSWVSWVIRKTIACRCAGVRMRPVSGFSKQPGHPGHLRKVTMIPLGTQLLPSVEGVPGEMKSPRTPRDPARTPRGRFA